MANDQPHDIQSVTEKNNDELKSNLQTVDNNSNSLDIKREDHKDEVSAKSSESAQSSDVQIDGKSTQKDSKHPVQKPSLTENDSDNNRQRTLSSSSSTSSSSDNETSNIPYEILNNDEDDDNDDHPSN